MLKNIIWILLKYKIWLLAILLLNSMFGVLLWLLDSGSFPYIFPTMLLGSLFLYCGIGFFVYRTDSRKEEAVSDFLNNPEILENETLLRFFSEKDKGLIRKIVENSQKKNETIRNQDQTMEEYMEYIESWAHEIKTPLSLMTFVLDNRRQEITTAVYHRLEYARTQMQEDIERMLYYARLKSSHTDYFFTKLSLDELCGDVIEEYGILMQEEKIEIVNNLKELFVFSDKKGLLFLLRQVFSNAVKYKKYNGCSSFIMIYARYEENGGQIRLTIRDNGIGIKPYDLPFIFEKGFTGEAGEYKQSSTGMGLYLAKQVADHLNVQILVSEGYTEGVELSFLFPGVGD